MPQPALMRLEILLPFRIFTQKTGVARIVAETQQGLFGLLPHRLDCVAALTPGILTYESADDGEAYLAVDQGVLVKTGPDVLVSTRRAFSGTDLAQLRDAVEQEFMILNAQEQDMRSVLARLETGFLRRLANFQND